MTNVARAGAEKRDAQLRARLGVLGYEHYRLAARQGEIDAEISQLEAALEVNAQIRRDIETDAAIDAAKKETDG